MGKKSKFNGKSSAFACDTKDGAVLGLSKREYFASAAMRGLIAADVNGCMDEEQAARYAVCHADALLDALAEE